MAKHTPKDERPKWYTASIEPVGMLGNPSRHDMEVRARSKEEVEAFLKSKGYNWKRITITEGQCIYRLSWNDDRRAERYHAELEAMLGKRFPPRYNSGPIYIGSNAPAEVQDRSARELWAKYVEEWSHGLSVSDVPHYLKVPGCGDIYLPALWVADPALWDECTGIVQRTVKQWKAHRVHMAAHHKGDRSPEARELQAQCLADVATLEALEGWTFPAFMERLSLGRNPSPFDVPHPGIWDINTRLMVPTATGRDYVKVEWWRQLLTIWDGPANAKAETVEHLLDHHHRYGGRAEVFRALVKSTLKRLHAIKETAPKGAEHWETLADVLEQWLAKAPKLERDTTSAKDKPKRPDLRLLALVHALRWLTRDKDADITKENAQALAEAAGAIGKESGRDLRKHYTSYTLKANHHANRLGHGAHHTVKKRYLSVIAMLEDHPKAKAMAEAELEELRERE